MTENRSLRVKIAASHIWVLCDVGAQFACNFVKPASRFSHRPAEWRQRVCHQKSRHQQSPECAASLGLQTLAGTLQPFPAICRFFPSVCVFWKEKKQTPVMTLLVSPQDFELNTELKMRVIGFLEEVMHDPELLTQERKAAANIIRSGFLVYDRCICRKIKFLQLYLWCQQLKPLLMTTAELEVQYTDLCSGVNVRSYNLEELQKENTPHPFSGTI